MSVYSFQKTQYLPITVNESWDFFSNPNNLKKITPPSLGLEIKSEISDEIYEGMIINYDVSLTPFYKTTWTTEITNVSKPHRFVDEQRIGPYRFWHHQHFFKEIDDGVLIEDLVHYSIPYGYIGRLLNHFYIAGNLDHIFGYRFDVLNKIFPKKGS